MKVDPVRGTAAVVASLSLMAVAGCGAGDAGSDADGNAGPIKVGFLASMTGPFSIIGQTEQQGVKLAVDQINADGGIDGRQVELITRDTKGDPTQAVNAATELTDKEEVDAILGPVLSGTGLAAIPKIATTKTLNLVLGSTTELVDAERWPSAFRTVPSNDQWIEAANEYALDILGAQKVALIGDSSGYGSSTLKQAETLLADEDVEIAYTALIDPNETDVTGQVNKAKESGADVLMVWSSATGLDARLLNARADAGWDVPVIGHPTLASTDTSGLLSDPDNWSDVYTVGFCSATYDKSGALPAQSQEFLDSVADEIDATDMKYSLWWLISGYDLLHILKQGIESAGSTDSAEVTAALASGEAVDGVFGDYRWSEDSRDGYPTDAVVMNRADSFDNGSYTIAPGYSGRCG